MLLPPRAPTGDRMKRAWVLSSLYIGLLCGCAVVRLRVSNHPEAQAKSSWSPPSGSTVRASDAITPQWWSQFGDPELDSLVTKAIAGNIDLKILAARIGVAKAQIAEAHAGALPTVDIGTGANLQK